MGFAEDWNEVVVGVPGSEMGFILRGGGWLGGERPEGVKGTTSVGMREILSDPLTELLVVVVESGHSKRVCFLSSIFSCPTGGVAKDLLVSGTLFDCD